MQVESLHFDTAKFRGNQLAAGGELVAKLEAELQQTTAVPSKDDFLKIVGEAYDRIVAPIDIPYVPNAIEPAFDIVLKSLVIKSASALYDRIAKSRAA